VYRRTPTPTACMPPCRLCHTRQCGEAYKNLTVKSDFLGRDSIYA